MAVNIPVATRKRFRARAGDPPPAPSRAERAAATRRANAIARAQRALERWRRWMAAADRAARRAAALRVKVLAAVRAGFLPMDVMDLTVPAKRRRKRAAKKPAPAQST